MKHSLGFTLIEVMIVVAILGIVSAITIPLMTGNKFHADYVCKAGYRFTYDGKQIIGSNGGGIKCDQPAQ